VTISLADARELVESHLALALDVPVTILDSQTTEYEFGWVFFYQSTLFLKTQEIGSALAGNAPIIVNRFTKELTTTGTAFPLSHYIEEYQRRLRTETSLKTSEIAIFTLRPQHNEKALTAAQIAEHLRAIPGWSYANKSIVKTYSFKNYYETIAFVNVVAAISHVTDHHPDLSVHYNRCVVAFNTHDVEQGKGGISMNDFICAARIEVFMSQTASVA
jgi:4a-hydroxytetrahydrobiopterin dehydratase